MILIPLVYCIVAAILLWCIIGTRGHWLAKAPLIVVVTWFSIAINLSIPTLLGWPTSDVIPLKFEVYWVKVVEPNKVVGTDGAIYGWLRTIKHEDKWQDKYFSLYKPNLREPRGYRLPYSREQHKAAKKAQGLLKQGKRVIGERGKGEMGKPSLFGKQGKKSKGTKGKNGGGDVESVPRFYELPPPTLPSKE